MTTSALFKDPPCETADPTVGGAALPLAAAGHALLLEDDRFFASMTRELLQNCCRRPFDVTHVTILKEAIASLSRGAYEIVLVDLNVPDSHGLDTVREVVQVNPGAPVIVLTGEDDMDVALGALSMGAQDFLSKSELNNRTLQRSIGYAIQRQQKETLLTSKAHFDCLTGLANRSLLYERWRRSLARAKRLERNVGVLIADIDRFKLVNDRHGHLAGDALLRAFSAELKSGVRESDCVARLGGDEFVVVLENVRSKEEVDSVRDTLVLSLVSQFQFEGAEIAFSASIGGALADPYEDEDLMSVLKRADAEMYEFKAVGRRGLAERCPGIMQ